MVIEYAHAIPIISSAESETFSTSALTLILMYCIAVIPQLFSVRAVVRYCSTEQNVVCSADYAQAWRCIELGDRGQISHPLRNYRIHPATGWLLLPLLLNYDGKNMQYHYPQCH